MNRKPKRRRVRNRVDRVKNFEGKKERQFRRFKDTLHEVYTLSERDKVGYYSFKTQTSLWELGIKEASWSINRMPYASTSVSCGGHTGGKEGTSPPYIRGFAMSNREYSRIRRSASDAGLSVTILPNREGFINFSIRDKGFKSVEESRRKFRQFGRNMGSTFR